MTVNKISSSVLTKRNTLPFENNYKGYKIKYDKRTLINLFFVLYQKLTKEVNRKKR